MKNVLKVAREYGLAVMLCLLILTFVMQLWRADLRVPFTYFGDSMYGSIAIKGTIERGWWWSNPALGAPGGLNYGAFPVMDNTQFLLIKVLTLFSQNHAVILNLFYLLTFPLTTVTSLFVFRQLKLSYLAGVVGSLLYTFLPYHFFRAYHIHMAAYYLLPLIIHVTLWVFAGPLIFGQPSGGRWPKLELNFKTVFALLVAVLVGGCGIYYPFFSCFFLLGAGALGSLQQKRIYPLLSAITLAVVIAGAVVISMTPMFLYQRSHGAAPLGTRTVADAETMGLKITQLLLPIGGHRVPALRSLKYRYNLGPLVNENDTSSLGFIGSVGFLLLLFRIFYQKPPAPILDQLSWLNLLGVLMGTIGGFGVLFALLVSPQIRAYNRISVFIAFFSLTAVAVLLDSFYKSLKTRVGWLAVIALTALLISAGVYDQTASTFFFVPEYEKTQEEYRSDAEFVSQIEAAVPPESMIFQLPYIRFPENPPVQKMTQDCEPAKAYLHSKRLRWSYGALKGGEVEQWQQAVAAQPTARFIDEIRAAGFKGIYINRNGYADNAEDLERQITSILAIKPIINRGGYLSFFPLTSEPAYAVRQLRK